MKKICAIFLSVVLTMSMIPATVFAGTVTTPPATTTEEKADIASAVVELAADSYVYTGNEIKPSVKSAKLADADILREVDVTYEENTNVGASAKVVLTAKKESTKYKGTVSKTFTITAADLSKAEKGFFIKVKDGTQDEIQNALREELNTQKLLKVNGYVVKNEDYNLVADTSKMIATVSAKTSNFTGEFKFNYVTAKDFAADSIKVEVSDDKFVYDGREKKPSRITVTTGTKGSNDYKVLTEGKDYLIKEYVDALDPTSKAAVNAGTAKVVLTGCNDYVGEKTVAFNIAKCKASSVSLESISGNILDTDQIRPKVTVSYGVAIPDKFLSYSYEKYGNKVRVSVMSDNIDGIAYRDYNTGKSILGAKLMVNGQEFLFATLDYTYNGRQQGPVVDVILDNKLLRRNYDYTISYENATNASEIGKYAKLIVMGQGEYAGRIEKEYTIKKQSISKATVSIYGGKTYITTRYGSVYMPEFSVRDVNGVTLRRGVDYVIDSYSDSYKKGCVNLTISGLGNYDGIWAKSALPIGTYTNDIGSGSFTATLSKTVFDYDGTAHRPTVTLKYADATLSPYADYDIKYVNNTNVGTASVVLTGKNGYTGTKTVYFTIKGKDQELTTERSSYVKYPGSADFNLEAKATGDGTGISYTSSDTSVVKVSLLGEVEIVGTGVANITVKTVGDKKFNPATKVVKVTVKPYKPKFTLESGKKGEAKVRITKDTGVTKYQIRYGRMGEYKNYYYKYSTSDYKTQLKTFKNLKSGKNYFIKVRAYKTMDDGTKVWGNWTDVKKVYVR